MRKRVNFNSIPLLQLQRMVLFRHSESAHTIMGAEGTEGVSDEDDPQKVHVTPLTDKNSLKKACDNDLQCNPKGNLIFDILTRECPDLFHCFKNITVFQLKSYK